MGRLSDAVINNMLDNRFGGVASDVPATVYVGLSKTLPTNTGGNVTEPSGGAYGRVPVPNDLENWPAAISRMKVNGKTVMFPKATSSWGSCTHFVLYDDPNASGVGAFLGWG